MTGRLKAYSLAVLLLLPLVLSGQTVYREVPELDFAHFQQNHITIMEDSAAFLKVFRKMDSLVLYGEGSLRIMHIGGSHVQAGTFTRQLRNNLLSLGDSLDGGRGLVFPFTAAKTNTPSSYRSRYEGEWTVARNVQREPSKRLGLTGMAVSSSDSTASVRIVLKARNPGPLDKEFKFNKVDVLGYSSGDREPLVLLPSGDSLKGHRVEEASIWTFVLPEMQDSVTVAVGRGTGELTITGIYLDNPKPGITVNEVGVNGAALTSYAKCQDLARDLRMVRPDLVIFAIGINDASGPDFSAEDFVNRYASLVAQVRSVNPDCAMLFVTNNDNWRRVRRRVYAPNKNTPVVREAFFRIAGECGGAVWDFFDIMGGMESMKDWQEAGLAKRDKIHFTEEGYSLIGDLLYNAIMAKYIEYIRRKL